MKQIATILAIAGTVGAAGLISSCNTAGGAKNAAVIEAQQNTIDSMKMEIVKQQVIDSMNEVARVQFVVPQTLAPVTREVAKAKATTTKRKPVARKKTRSTYASSNNQPVAQAPAPVYRDPAPVYNEPAPAPVEEKKGWSAKAKGAVIGAGTGAVAGAVINKRNRAVGAVIGGVLGAGAGTGIGAIIDKKNGR